MKPANIVLAILLVIPGMLAGGQDEKKAKDRVRAKQPTVVTVEGKADQVDPRKTEPEERSLPGKVGNGIVKGISSAGRAFVRFGGWLMNTDDDIPSERERKERAAQRSQQ